MGVQNEEKTGSLTHTSLVGEAQQTLYPGSQAEVAVVEVGF